MTASDGCTTSTHNAAHAHHNQQQQPPLLPKPVDSARHICGEARVVLSYLRGGPPAVAHGELAHNLRHLRRYVKAEFLEAPPPPPPAPRVRLGSHNGGSIGTGGGGDDFGDGTTGDNNDDNNVVLSSPAAPSPQQHPHQPHHHRAGRTGSLLSPKVVCSSPNPHGVGPGGRSFRSSGFAASPLDGGGASGSPGGGAAGRVGSPSRRITTLQQRSRTWSSEGTSSGGGGGGGGVRGPPPVERGRGGNGDGTDDHAPAPTAAVDHGGGGGASAPIDSALVMPSLPGTTGHGDGLPPPPPPDMDHVVMHGQVVAPPRSMDGVMGDDSIHGPVPTEDAVASARETNEADDTTDDGDTTTDGTVTPPPPPPASFLPGEDGECIAEEEEGGGEDDGDEGDKYDRGDDDREAEGNDLVREDGMEEEHDIHDDDNDDGEEYEEGGEEDDEDDDDEEEQLIDYVAIEQDVGHYARPFLDVITDPRAAGPQTLAAVRALHRLLDRGSLLPLRFDEVALRGPPSWERDGASAASPTMMSEGEEEEKKHDGDDEGAGAGTTTGIHHHHARRRRGRPPPAHDHAVSLEPLMRGILSCRFEQTDAEADEAVEMAIADLLSLVMTLDAKEGIASAAEMAASARVDAAATTTTEGYEDEKNGGTDERRRRRKKKRNGGNNNRGVLSPMLGRIRMETRMEAFNMVFVNRNTYVHSPALCYHFDTVLNEMVMAAFSLVDGSISDPHNDPPRRRRGRRRGRDSKGGGRRSPTDVAARRAARLGEDAARPIMEFLVQQLLHTPLLHAVEAAGGGGVASAPTSNGGMSSSAAVAGGGPVPSTGRVYVNEAQIAHDANRVLCLKLVRSALRIGWGGGVACTGRREVFQYNCDFSFVTSTERVVTRKVSSSGLIRDYSGGGTGATTTTTHPSSSSSSGPVRNLARSMSRRMSSGKKLSRDDTSTTVTSSGRSLTPPPTPGGGSSLASRSPSWSSTSGAPLSPGQQQHHHPHGHTRPRTLLEIVQDDLCLSLLLTGQAIGCAGLSLEVLSEVCATIATLWGIPLLRRCALNVQMESLFNGIFQRALVLLRNRPVPDNSYVFQANSVFDSECEIILETLVDILCLHDDDDDVAYGGGDGDKSFGAGGWGGGALEELYATYDCDLNRSDVAEGLVLELCRCSGATAVPSNGSGGDADDGTAAADLTPSDRGGSAGFVGVNVMKRQVPAHLKELCAEALLGGCLKSLFRHIVEQPPSQQFQQPLPQMPDDAAHPGPMSFLPVHLLRMNKEKKRILKRGAALFNRKATEGIKFMASSHVFSSSIGRATSAASPPAVVTPKDVATFLRQAIVFGLDKSAVGQYLGETGKAPKAGKNPHEWERDWFHRDVLEEYCNLFHFQNQSLLDCLRMFLSSFRLPGEAQQIDRILQAFAESCAHNCNEAVRLRYFSDDPKKASDGAYLLAFSIIMLNTDLHNDNIRPDRKMTVDGFVRNNTNYGRDITDPGKDFPREFLVEIYDSIKEEEIRTEREGAEGVMTVERWKDVLRSRGAATYDRDETGAMGADDGGEPLERGDIVLPNLVLENVWSPVLSAVGGFWEVSKIGVHLDPDMDPADEGNSGNAMLNAEGARLGMDLAFELLAGVRLMNRHDIFQSLLMTICGFTGLLQYAKPVVDRREDFVHSIQRQSAVVVVMNTVKEYGDFLSVEAWKCIFAMIFELRDLKLLGVRGGGLLAESDPDLLKKHARNDRTIRLMKEGYGGGYGKPLFEEMDTSADRKPIMGGLILGAMGRMFFGDGEGKTEASPSDAVEGQPQRRRTRVVVEPTIHGKERLLIWNDLAPSDDEDEGTEDEQEEEYDEFLSTAQSYTAGAAFESQLVHEDHLVFVESAPQNADAYQNLSSAGRVRRRLGGMCDFFGLVAESRFLTLTGMKSILMALMEMIRQNGLIGAQPPAAVSQDGGATVPAHLISPASEALAEVLICEITLKNKDRLGSLWPMLHRHYEDRLGLPPAADGIPGPVVDESDDDGLASPGIEKCVTGLVRIACCLLHRGERTGEVIRTLSLLYPPVGRRIFTADLLKHISEGTWRICRNVDGLAAIEGEDWNDLLGLLHYCAQRGGSVVRAGPGRGGLSEDDATFHAFRSLHLILNTPELVNKVPFNVIRPVRMLIVSGERGGCPKLCVAGLDLLSVLHGRLETQFIEQKENVGIVEADLSLVLSHRDSVLEGISEAAKTSLYGGVRQHALTMLTDAVVGRHGVDIPAEHLYSIVHFNCISVAGLRINTLVNSEDIESAWEEVMIELKLCISLVFKPFLHHLKILLTMDDKFPILWESMLNVMEQLLGDDKAGSSFDPEEEEFRRDHSLSPAMTRDALLLTTKELGKEHLRNAVMVLMSYGIITAGEEYEEGKEEGGNVVEGYNDLSALTWNTIGTMSFCRDDIEEWKNSELDGATADIAETDTYVANSAAMARQEMIDDKVDNDEEEDDEASAEDIVFPSRGEHIHPDSIPDGGENTCEKS